MGGVSLRAHHATVPNNVQAMMALGAKFFRQAQSEWARQEIAINPNYVQYICDPCGGAPLGRS
jgi:hypothetical protein